MIGVCPFPVASGGCHVAVLSGNGNGDARETAQTPKTSEGTGA